VQPFAFASRIAECPVASARPATPLQPFAASLKRKALNLIV
jgi:hypothetical protein